MATPNDCASMDTMSASAGGFTTPSDTASAMETISSAPFAWAISAIAATSSIVPKKFGDWISTHAVSLVIAASSAAMSTRAIGCT